MKELLSLTLKELEELIIEMKYPKFRAKQIYEWMYKGIDEYNQMTNIPKNMICDLKETYRVSSIVKTELKKSNMDDTRKYIFTLDDGIVIESVFMKYKHGTSVCLSTQAGCKMGCKFCASSCVSFERDLTSGEMIGQILKIQKDTGERIKNIVLMGIGEPFDNYENIIRFIKIIRNENGLNIGARRITLSTCGIINGIEGFMEEGFQVNLSISLHAPNDDIRKQLMPIAKSQPIDKLLDICNIYTRTTKRRITFEYLLIKDLNDKNENAIELAKRIKGMLCHVNLIPFNSIPGMDLERSEITRIQSFQQVLQNNKIPVSIRRELGSDIEAACGQLRREIKTNKD